ncbi:MAG: phenylalanine--tRNA ligase subunit beta [Oscillospiraceae bacterium]
MKLSRKWLGEFVDLPLAECGDRAFAEAMTLSGSMVEGTECMGEDIKNVVVGKIIKMERHPDSDHMWVCQTDVGGARLLQIVTGAQNQKEGDLVPVALDNSLLPGGKEINTTVFRGVLSEGMMCSLKELGLELRDFPYAFEDGLFVIEEDCLPGDDIRSVTGLDDHVAEFEITPNRPDCLSVIGLAREAAVTFNKPLRLHTPIVRGCADAKLSDMLSVTVTADDLCPRYTARMVKNVKIAPSPKWLRERLRASGVRPINNIVDITNYVMLEYGQPMHAFDYRYVTNGKIVVRRAAEGEALTTLDGGTRKLTRDMLVIADENRAVGLAGIMGGENSEIVSDTSAVVFESATFNGTCIRRGALALGMRTEASAKFEKGLDPMNTLPAVQRACELVELLGAGEVVDGIIDVENHSYTPTSLKLRADKINELLGTDISAEAMTDILRRLDFVVDGDTVTVPSWRGDVEHYSDLAEEVARIHGYNNLPTTLLRGDTTRGGLSTEEMTQRSVGAVCRSVGYDEIITYSFISPSYYDRIRWAKDDPRRESLRILNPLGEDTSIMRTTALPSMLEILARNYNFRNRSARLYEIAKTYFRRADGLADEPRVVVLGAYGDGMSFYKLKGAVEAILADLKIAGASFVADRENPSYHPGRCAKVYAGKTLIGVFGQLHPAVAVSYGIADEVFAAELSFDALFAARETVIEYTPLPRFPAVTRDIAVVCGETLTVGELKDCITAAGGQYLKDVTVFDVYTGAPIPAGKKSVAFTLTLRAEDQTLTDDHADESLQSILAALRDTFGAVIR